MNFDELTFDEIKALAKSVEGLDIHHATGEVKYRAEFQAYIDDNPGCLDNLKIPEDDVEDTKDPELVKAKPGDDSELLEIKLADMEKYLNAELKESKLLREKIADLEAEISDLSGEPVVEEKLVRDHKLKSPKMRGEISSSAGVVYFEKDGIAKCTKKQYNLFIKLEGYEKC